MLDELGQVFDFVFCSGNNFKIAQACLEHCEVELKKRKALKEQSPKDRFKARSFMEWVMKKTKNAFATHGDQSQAIRGAFWFDSEMP
jgi:hypothetical protein